MTKSARQTVFEGQELLPTALAPFVEKRLDSAMPGGWQRQVVEKVKGLYPNASGKLVWDQARLLKVMITFWKEAFAMVLGPTERALVPELLEVRHTLAHDGALGYDDAAERALDSMRRLMDAIGAGELARMRETIVRVKYRELDRNEERRKSPQVSVATETAKGLLPWRQVVEPHQDVASGAFQQAEFAADLAKVHEGSAPAEYGNPQEFFSRTYLTEGLSTLLVGAAQRLSGLGGNPVVELQTNFGGGKTHSMLALYDMTGEMAAQDLPGLDQLLADQGLAVPSGVNRAVLVGTAPGTAGRDQAGRWAGDPHHLGRPGLAVGTTGGLRPGGRAGRQGQCPWLQPARGPLQSLCPLFDSD